MQDIREKIIAWLVDEDHEVKVETPPKGAPIEWVLKVTAKIPPVLARVVIQQPSNKKDRIVVTLGVVVSPQHRDALSKLSLPKRQEVIHKILVDAYKLCPDCVIVVQPNYIDPQSIVITDIIYVDELTKPRLSSSIRKMTNMLAIISAGFNAYLEVIPSESRRGEERQPPSFI